MRTPPQTARYRARVILRAVACAIALVSCEPGGIAPSSSADCAAAGACSKSGRCSFDPKSKRCVVGSNADCARADICHIDQRCRMVGDTCDK